MLRDMTLKRGLQIQSLMMLYFHLSAGTRSYLRGRVQAVLPMPSMTAERIIDDIEQLEEMFEVPDIRPLSTSDIYACEPKAR
jgi:hypothetical protein